MIPTKTRDAAVRAALRSALKARGREVAADTVGLRGELYLRGEGDRVAALFEFKATAGEAMETMYQGSWPLTLPPRFAVLPEEQKEDPWVEILAQAGLSVLFYRRAEGEVVFLDLEAALGRIDGNR